MKYQEIEPASCASDVRGGVDALWEHPSWIVEKKHDGWRFLHHFGGKLKRSYFTGRRISKETGRFSEKGECCNPLWPSNTVLKHTKYDYTVIDGEVMPPEGAHFRDIASIMNVTPEKAAARIKEIGPPQYAAFDILFYNGRDVRALPLSDRHELLTNVMLDIFKYNPSVYRGEYVDEPTHKEPYYVCQVADGAEGVVLKDLRAPYGEGWVKVKRFSTLDVVITGFTEANHGKTGKYAGLIGAVVCSVRRGKELVEVAQVSGMVDADRVMFTKNQKKLIGTVMEIKAQEMAKDRLRHPRFLRLRPEADARHATWDKMLKDLQANKR